MATLAIKTKNKDSNYLAKVFQIKNIRKHSNADRLRCTIVDGNNVITGANAQEGDVYVYFPIECTINLDYLSFCNSFRNAELNQDKKTVGFFEPTGRVKALKLRGEKSEGYIVPVDTIIRWLVSLGHDVKTPLPIGEEFDSIGDILLCEKFVVRTARQHGTANNVKNGGGVKRFNKLLPNSYTLAQDTSHLKKNMHRITPETEITITYKMHGCNFSMGRVLCKKNLKWYQKLWNFFGGKIPTKGYENIYASRRVIQNQFEQEFVGKRNVWGDIFDRYSHVLTIDGLNIHGEIVGQNSNGGWIQNRYDYGIPPMKSELFVYRIFEKTNDTFVEYTTQQVLDFCVKNNLHYTPIFFNGKAKDVFPEIAQDENWSANFLSALTQKYTEKNCFMCVNKVPEEGVVVILNTENRYEAFKLKSFRFLEMESAELDKGEVNTDDA